MNITNKFDEYMNIVIQNFSSYINDNELLQLEQLRIAMIKNVLIILAKLYNDIKLDDLEKNVINKYHIIFDCKENITKNIASVVYSINEDVHNNAMLVYYKKHAKNLKDNLSGIDESNWNYIVNLRKYNQDILHSITHDHEISIIDINTHKCVKPVINFNNECFTIINDKVKKKII